MTDDIEAEIEAEWGTPEAALNDADEVLVALKSVEQSASDGLNYIDAQLAETRDAKAELVELREEVQARDHPSRQDLLDDVTEQIERIDAVIDELEGQRDEYSELHATAFGKRLRVEEAREVIRDVR
jgi:hypothetical protein